MKILAVSDEIAPPYYDYYRPGCLADFDLILACGDLPRDYLEFLATMARCPLLYVHGNHDTALDAQPPEGCICIDGKLYVRGGVRILGLGGSHRYREGRHQYTEAQMRRRILRLLPRICRAGGVDILVTHAPARHLNDMDTPAHQGFACFGALLEKYRPRLFIHGHIHRNYGVNIPQRTEYGNTTVINACGYCIVTL